MKKHSLPTPYVCNIPSNSPIHYKDKTSDEEPPNFLLTPTRESETEFPLGKNTYIFQYFKEIYILRKGKDMIRIHEPELRQLLDTKPLVDSCIQEYLDGKKVKFLQNIGKDLYLIIRSPYRCVDLRKMWTIPNTDQLVSTKFGIPLAFTEYKELINVLEEVFMRGKNVI